MGKVTFCKTCKQSSINCECDIRKDYLAKYFRAKHISWDCKHVHKEGAGCSLNNNCKFPDCQHLN